MKKSPLSNKTFVVFIGLKHHYQRLKPICDALEKCKARVLYLTAKNVSFSKKGNRECFEKNLIENNIPYKHIYNYRDKSLSAEFEDIYKKIYEQIEKLDLSDLNLLFSQFDSDDFNLAINDAIEANLLLKRVFDKEKPDAVIALHEVNFWAKLLFMEADKRAIKAFSFQEGLYDCSERRAEKYSLMAEFSDVFLWGKNAKNTLQQFGASEKKLFVTGNPQFDDIYKNNFQIKSIIQDKYKKILILLPNPYQDYKEALPLEILGKYFKSQQKYNVYIKWHPRDAANNYSFAEYLLKEFNIKSYFNESISEVITDFDLCMVLDSSAGMDALLNRIPLLEINFSNNEYGRSYAEKNVALNIASEKDLDKINKVFRGEIKTFKEVDLQNFLYDNFYKDDGKALERIMNIIEDEIG